jgi:hypothetical protein
MGEPNLVRVLAKSGEVPLLPVVDAREVSRLPDPRAGTVSMLPASCTRRDSASYDVDVPARSKILVLHTSYAPGWEAEAGGKRLEWRHVAVDGFLNGWLISNDAPAHVSLVYTPARIFRALQAIAIVVLACLVVSVGGLAMFRRGS